MLRAAASWFPVDRQEGSFDVPVCIHRDFFLPAPNALAPAGFCSGFCSEDRKKKNTFFPLLVFLCKNIVQWNMSSCYENNWSVVADSGSVDSVTDILRWTHA